MGLANNCLKIISAIFQTTFAISGIALIAYGAFTAYSILITNSAQIIRDYLTVLPSAITILLGLLLVILVIVGCCGLCKESKYCVEFYAAFLFLLAFVQLAFGGYCIIAYGNPQYTSNLREKIIIDIRDAIFNYKEYPEKVDDIQSWMKCCGHLNVAYEYKNYGIDQFPRVNQLPPSCCSRSAESCTFNSKELYRKTCSDTVADFTVITNQIMGWISVVIGTTELIAAFLGICLSCCIWRNQMGSWR